MHREVKEKVISYLETFVTEERSATIQKVLDQRSRRICVVLEDIYQPHNASAVLRSCDCFGIQNVHVIENKHQFDTHKSVTIGADQWLTIFNYRQENLNNTKACFDRLHDEGYSIVATTPHEEDTTVDELPADRKTALVFGAELTGLSDYAMEKADAFVRVPMFGFSESYNISVSAALCMYDLSLRMRKSGADWQLTENEKIDLKLKWLEQSLRAGKKLKARFLEEHGYEMPGKED